jgi:NAD-dependent dihydropyrimidine dehydrogenase PreA subunit
MTATTPTLWHGIPRREIPWFPTVDTDTCIGCGLCFVTCGRGVYDMQNWKAQAAKPYECMVGCSTCATVCPTSAIRFPEKALVHRVEREHKIFKIVQEEAKAKRGKQDALKARAEAEGAVAKLTTRARLELAGNFGAKAFLVQLEKLIADHPVDIVNLQLHVPTVKGLLEGTPGFMSLEVTSTRQEDIQTFLPRIRDLALSNALVLVQETRV